MSHGNQTMDPAKLKEWAVDGTQFAAGLRQIGRRVTRRGAFAALVAGAVLNKTAPGSDATKRAGNRWRKRTA